MPAFVQTSASRIASPSIVVRPRMIPSRVIEKVPPKHGEKPFEQLVADAFDGPVLRLSQRMRLLEEAGNRKIRRGDAIDLIESFKQQAEQKHSVRKPGRKTIFAKQFAAFATVYALAAA